MSADSISKSLPEDLRSQENYRLANVHEEEGEDKEAFKYYLRAAEAGHPDAQYSLGMMYMAGRVPGILGNLEQLLESYKWFLLASKDSKYKVPVSHLRRRFEGSDPGLRGYENLLQKLSDGSLTTKTKLAPSVLNPYNNFSPPIGKDITRKDRHSVSFPKRQTVRN